MRPLPLADRRSWRACSSAPRTKPAWAVLDARQPTMRRQELAVHPVSRAQRRPVADRGAHRLATRRSLQAHVFHQPGHCAACHVDAVPPQLPPDFANPINLEVRLPAPSVGMGVVSRRGDRQHSADRLDPVNGVVCVDEGEHFLNGRSGSAWAKYADALRKTSFAWRNSRTSRSSALIRSCSSVVGPGRLPWSHSACRTQFRSVSGLQPIFAAIELIAAHCDACSPSCSNTIRTARSRTSGTYLGDAGFVMMTPLSQMMGPPEKPARFR